MRIYGGDVKGSQRQGSCNGVEKTKTYKLKKKKVDVPVLNTYREKHHRDGEGDGGQHGQAHNEKEHVGLVDLGVGVQQLGLHMNCGEKKARRHETPER